MYIVPRSAKDTKFISSQLSHISSKLESSTTTHVNLQEDIKMLK